MPFGIGLFELLVVLAVVACPVALAVLGIRALSRRSVARDRLGSPPARQLAAELDSTQRRLGELEAKLARTEEKLAYTESMLDDRKRP